MLYFEINSDSFSCDGNIQSGDDETVDAVVLSYFNDIKEWQIERTEGQHFLATAAVSSVTDTRT